MKAEKEYCEMDVGGVEINYREHRQYGNDKQLPRA